ncbi:MAG: YcaQ family DNA glycosylase, partial [Caulobacterales bacterium]|nr:YcaQ family DNA glycosylase [Caulobacterales bacterium]
LEWLFWTGQITTLTRRGFERVYDLTERALPAAIVNLPTPTEADAQRELVRRSARAMGVASEADLPDSYRLPLEGARRAVRELVEAGELTPVKVQGWDKPGYLHPDAKPRRISAHALLSPFDNLIWFRDRTERLFGIRVRLEIYTPAEKRVHGYYVLPFLEGETITARVDLKADRQAKVLRVQAAHAEPEAGAGTPTALAAELVRMAGWLGLDGVAVAGKGDLAGRLQTALEAPAS